MGSDGGGTERAYAEPAVRGKLLDDEFNSIGGVWRTHCQKIG
jgi:hypothetical protein